MHVANKIYLQNDTGVANWKALGIIYHYYYKYIYIYIYIYIYQLNRYRSFGIYVSVKFNG